MTIPFLNLKAAHNELNKEMSDAFERVLSSGWYIQGTEVRTFESEFSSYCQTEHCVGVGNGVRRAALNLASI